MNTNDTVSTTPRVLKTVNARYVGPPPYKSESTLQTSTSQISNSTSSAKETSPAMIERKCEMSSEAIPISMSGFSSNQIISSSLATKAEAVTVTGAISLGSHIVSAASTHRGFASEVLTGESVLTEAQRLTHGDRNSSYGHPLDDYSRTAKLWSAILGIDVSAEQAALCMCAVKISRQCNKSKRDNMTDLAGYAWVVDEIVEETKRREAAI